MKSDYFFGVSAEGFHRVAYREWGDTQQDSVPIICVHGMTRNAQDFDTLADHLSGTGRHVFCPDVVGRGDSDWLKNKQNYSFEQYIADMTTLIARTGATQLDWIGTSMGGLIGILMAALPNSPIRRLIINDIGPQIPAKAIRRLSQYTDKEPTFNSLATAIAYFKFGYSSFGELSEDQWKKLTLSSIRETSPGHYICKVDPGLRHVPSKGSFLWKLLTHPKKALEGILFDIDLWDQWQKINCPVYVIHGKQSDLLLPAIISKMQATHAGVEVLTVENAGHAPVLEEKNMLDTITKWLG